MSKDAKFEDGAERPIRLQAADGDDLQVISSLAQDAVFPITEMSWLPRQRRFGLLVNRFRWEDAPGAEARSRPFERVQAVLAFDDVTAVRSQGIDRDDKDTVLSLLAIDWHPTEDGAGRIELVLAGDGAIALDVECINATLRDVTRPYQAPSGKAPKHD